MFRRAVELAASGKCKRWHDIQKRLVKKGIAGLSLSQTLSCLVVDRESDDDRAQ